MSAAIEVRVTDDGQFQARRRDGLPLTEQDKAEARRMALEKEQADPTEGKIIAVKICSHVLDACIWLALDESFKPDDDEQLAVFYATEIALLRDKSPETLRKIHEARLIFNGARVVDSEEVQ